MIEEKEHHIRPSPPPTYLAESMLHTAWEMVAVWLCGLGFAWLVITRYEGADRVADRDRLRLVEVTVLLQGVQ